MNAIAFNTARFHMPAGYLAALAPVPTPAPAAPPGTTFHDIKALPHFAPFPVLLALITLLVLAALTGAWWLRKRRRARREAAPPPPGAAEIASAELARLEGLRASGQISLREFGTALSLVLRRYLEHRLSFPASDMTSLEVTRALPGRLKAAFPFAGEDKLNEIRERAKLILAFCERTTYADDSEKQLALDAKKVADAVRAVERVVKDIERLVSDSQTVAGAAPAESAAGPNAGQMGA